MKITRPSLIAQSALLLMVAITGVACAPSTFDNITGGAPPPSGDENKGPVGAPRSDKRPIDASLAAPRPIAPISVSWVNTNRPKFRWELKEGSTGAIVELSRTRDFKGEVRHVIGNGTETTLAEDQKLEPGFWFWRLRGHNTNADGEVKPEKEAPVWEFLVRGPSAGVPSDGKPSDAPQGAIVDMNGDGEPDLVISVEVKSSEYPTSGPPTFFAQETLLGNKDTHTFAYDEGSIAGFGLVGPSDYSLTGGTDLDGDGFPDLVNAMLVPRDSNPNEKIGFYNIEFGNAEGVDIQKSEEVWLSGLPVPDFTTQPIVHAAGDLNGDGYGDFTAILPTMGYASLGSTWGPNQVMFFAPFFETPTPTTASPFCAAGDLDGDGFTDIAMAGRSASSPINLTKGSRDRFDAPASLTMNGVTPLKATALTMGDFEGTTMASIAFVTQIKDANGIAHGAVCVYAPSNGPLEDKHCWKSAETTTAPTFGLSIAAGDLDGDGRDDIVVGSASGIIALSRKKDGSPGFDEKVIAAAGAFRPYLTMIHPGLHIQGASDPARWAAISATEKSITIFKGTESLQKIPMDKPWVVSVGNVMR
jgi:hypothetical protein